MDTKETTRMEPPLISMLDWEQQQVFWVVWFLLLLDFFLSGNLKDKEKRNQNCLLMKKPEVIVYSEMIVISVSPSIFLDCGGAVWVIIL